MNVVLEVEKADLLVFRDAVVNLVHVVVDGLVHGLDSIFYENLAVQKLRLMNAGQRLDLLDQRGCFLVGDELGGLDAVYQQFQLRKLKIPVGDIVPAGAARACLYNIQAEVLKCFNVAVNTLPFSRYALGIQKADDLIDGNGMIFVGILQEVFHDVERFEFLIRRTSHTLAVLSVSTHGADHLHTNQHTAPLTV